MKILRINSLGYECGGSENGILLLDPVLRDRGHTVKVLSSDHRPELSHFSDYEFKAIEAQPFLLKAIYRIFYPQAYFTLRRVLREYQPDVVQLHTLYQVSPSVLFLLRKYPTIVTVHGAEDYTLDLLSWAFPRRFFKKGVDVFVPRNLNAVGKIHYLYHKYLTRPMYLWGFRNVETFLVMSKYMQKKLAEEGLQCTHVPNATRLFTPEPIDSSGSTILYTGRLEKIKGVQFVLRALPEIAKVHRNVKFVIAGTGPYEQQLKSLVQEMHLSERVDFVGHRTREELRELYKKATVATVPSVWPEPFGKVGIEALSIGRPVVASNVGGISEWLADGKVGHLVPPKDSHALAAKFIHLFNDRELLQQMSKNAVEQAAQFSIESYATRIVELYQDAIHKHAGS